MTLIVLRNTIFKMINIWQHHVWTDMHKRLASVHSILGRGSLIPLPTIDVGETSQIKQQAIRVTMTLMALQNATFSIIEIEERRRVQKRYKEYDGCYLGHYAQWFFWFFFTIGFSVVAGGLAMLIAQYFAQ